MATGERMAVALFGHDAPCGIDLAAWTCRSCAKTEHHKFPHSAIVVLRGGGHVELLR
jgi:hypothetical protein